MKQSTKNHTASRPSVVIFQRIIPHYRIGIFSTIAGSNEFHYRFVTALTQEGSFHLPPLDSMPFQVAHKPLSTFNIFGKSVRFHWEEIRLALWGSDNVLVFPADLHQPSYLIASIIARIRGKKVIHWGHGISRGGNERGIVKAFRKISNALSHAYLLYGLREFREYKARGYKMSSYFVTKNALDTKPYRGILDALTPEGLAQFKEKRGLENKQCVIFVGRLIDEKKVSGAIEAIHYVKKEFPNLVLLIVGDGPERSSLEQMAKDRGVEENVLFTGALYDDEELAYLYKSSCMAISPGYVGLMVNHAFMCGTPVVTNDNYWEHSPEVAMIEDGKTGLFFKENDWKDLAAKISTTLHSPEQLASMGKRCEKLIREEYNETHMAKVFDDAVRYSLSE